MLQFRLNHTMLEVLKFKASPLCLQDMLEIKKSSNSMRDSPKRVQAKGNTRTFGH